MLIPVAKKLGSSLAPGMFFANSGLNWPPTVETLTPTFSKTFPAIWPRTPPPPGPSLVSVRSHDVYVNLASLPVSRSIFSNCAQIRSRSVSNQSRAAFCWSSSSSIATSLLHGRQEASRDAEQVVIFHKPAVHAFGGHLLR